MAIELNKLPLMKNDPINMNVLILHFVHVHVHVTSQIKTRLIHPKQVLFKVQCMPRGTYPCHDGLTVPKVVVDLDWPRI